MRMSALGHKRTLRATCRPILFDHLVGETVVELPLFNERGKLNRAVVQDFDARGGAANAHGADRRFDIHVAGMRHLAGDEGERTLCQTH